MPVPTAPVALLAVLQAVALFSFFLAAYAFAQRRVSCAAEFCVFMVAVGTYAAGYALELSRSDLPGILSALRVEYLGNVFIPLMWLLFARRFSGKAAPRPALLALLLAVPLLTIVMVWTSPWHELYYVNPRVRSDGPFAVFAFDKGPFYWLYVAFFQACTLWGNVLLIGNALKAGRVRRVQSLTVAAASLLPWLLYVFYLFGLTPWGIDSGPFSASAAGAFFGLAIFRLGMFAVVPAARDQAISALGDGYLVTDRRGIVLDANRAVARLLGWEGLSAGEDIPADRPGAKEILSLVAAGEGGAELVLPLREPIAVEGIETECFPSGGVEGCPEAERKEGMSHERRLSLEASPVADRSGRVVACAIVIRDITRVTALVGRLRELAGTDPLTGLSNRRRFFEMAQREVEVARRARSPLGLCIIDLDLFKDVNDHYGHLAGDAVLREAAARFRSCLRSTDLICRHGGEEFAILLPGSDAEAARLTAERLRQALSARPMAFEGGSVRVTASIGVHGAVPEEPGTPGSVLDRYLRLADEALYKAKDGGRDLVVLSP